jgi:hypothetical protein
MASHHGSEEEPSQIPARREARQGLTNDSDVARGCSIPRIAE